MNFRAVLVLPEMAGSAQTHKSMSFIWIVWSTLYVYLWLNCKSVKVLHGRLFFVCTAIRRKRWCFRKNLQYVYRVKKYQKKSCGKVPVSFMFNIKIFVKNMDGPHLDLKKTFSNFWTTFCGISCHIVYRLLTVYMTSIYLSFKTFLRYILENNFT